ncbi:MAG: cation:proton antiporter, partial [Ignavibacteriaceae bacterium]
MNLFDINVLLMAVGGTLLFLELTAGYLKYYLYISEPIIATFIGILIGPYLLNLVDLQDFQYHTIFIEEIARLTLAVTLMGVAFRLPRKFVFENWKDLIVLICIVLPLMFIISGFLIYIIIGLPLLISLLIGAIVSPTDPVLASAIVTSEIAQKYIPERLRNIISSESALNDALAFPFVMIPLLLLSFSPIKTIEHMTVDV